MGIGKTVAPLVGINDRAQRGAVNHATDTGQIASLIVAPQLSRGKLGNAGAQLLERSAAREIFKRQLLDGFGFDVEVLYIAKELGYRVADVPVRWNDVPGTKVSMALAIKSFEDPVKVRWNGIRGRYK